MFGKSTYGNIGLPQYVSADRPGVYLHCQLDATVGCQLVCIPRYYLSTVLRTRL